MARVKKISDIQFVEDVINFELKNYGVTYADIRKLPVWKTKDEFKEGVEYQNDWYTRYVFRNYDEYYEWKKYFYEHFKDWQPQYKWKREIIDREFAWFNLQFGLKWDFEWEEFRDLDKNAPNVFDVVYKKKKKDGTEK